MKKFLFLLLIFCFPLIVNADDNGTFTITCDNTNVEIGDQIVCRTSINAKYDYNKIKFDYNISDGLSLIDVRSNYEAMWKITNDEKSITAKINNDTIQNGLQEFGILLLKANKSGKQTIKMSNITLDNTKDSNSKNIPESGIDIKVISSDNELKAINIDDKPIANFSPENTNYNIEVTNEKKIKIESFTSNEFATVTGNGEYDLDEKDNNYIIPIIVTSEAGTNRIYTITINRPSIKEDGIPKKLKSLVIKDDKNNTILFNFNSEEYFYDIDLDSSDTSINIIPELSDDNLSFVKNYGKQTLKLVSGDNIALIKIVDDSGQTKTYVINITKPLSNKSDNSYLSQLLIKGYKFSFSKKVKNYKLLINKFTNKLNIEATPENENAIVSIEGNEDLKKDSTIKIIVTAEDESKSIYSITIGYKRFNLIPYIVVAIVILSVVLLIRDNKLRQKKVIITAKQPKELPKTEVKNIQPKIEAPTPKKQEATVNAKQPKKGTKPKSKNKYSKKKYKHKKKKKGSNK
jgi:hypothetical protein